MPAFIGAEGFGAGANGWRSASATIQFVTNLNNSGAGSLRQAIEGVSGPRYIIFRVAGYITNTADLTTENNTGVAGSFYLAGQTAPGGGITIRSDGVTLAWQLRIRHGHVCIRHVRVRQRAGTGNAIDLSGSATSNVIFDHVSTTWSLSDDAIGLSPSIDLVTFQHCLIGEGNKALLLYYSGGATGRRVSAHHNYMCHVAQRLPALQGGDCEIVNNLLYNVGRCGGVAVPIFQEYTNDFGTPRVNNINNLAKEGPMGGPCTVDIGIDTRHSNQVPANGGSLYHSGNTLIHPTAGTVPFRIVASGGGFTLVGSAHSFSPAVPITVQSATGLDGSILPNVGCTKPVRDSVDQAIVDSYAAFTGNSDMTTENQTVGGTPFPAITSGTAAHLEPSGMTQEFINRMGLSNTVTSALSTSVSVNRGLGEDYQNIEWNLMEAAGDIGPLSTATQVRASRILIM